MHYVYEFIIAGRIPFTDIIFDFESFIAGVLAFMLSVLVFGKLYRFSQRRLYKPSSELINQSHSEVIRPESAYFSTHSV